MPFYIGFGEGLTEKNKLEKDADKHLERYTIFHALFQALKEKEKKHKKE